MEEGIPLIPRGRFHQVHYEDLVADPIGEMEKLYERLELGGFEEYVPRLKSTWPTIPGMKPTVINSIRGSEPKSPAAGET